MAQVKPFKWYQHGAPVAIPGMKADATTDVVDSYAAEEGLNPGDPVVRGTDAEKQIKVAGSTEGADVIGIAVHTHKAYDGTGAYYEEGYTVPVMSFGDVYVEAGSAVTAGDAVALDKVSDALAYVAKDATGDTTYRSDLPACTFMDSGAKGDIVRVRIRK